MNQFTAKYAAGIQGVLSGFDRLVLRGTLRRLLMDTLTTDAIEATGVFDARSIHAMISDHMERRVNVGYHLCGLLTLFLWMKRWKVEAPPVVEALRPMQTQLLALR